MAADMQLVLKSKTMGTVIGVFVDDKIEQAMYERAFQKWDHKVQGYVFNTPEQGIMVARETPLDVVFIEIHFWGENFGGISILNQLKKASNNQVIAIAMTSLLQDGDIEKIIEAGFSMCIEKPVSMEALQLFCTGASHN
jgi:CheY-like chemotaxis protein